MCTYSMSIFFIFDYMKTFLINIYMLFIPILRNSP